MIFHNLTHCTLLFLWVNESLVLSLKSSFKVQFDPPVMEPVMILPNPVRVLIQTQRTTVVMLQKRVFAEGESKPVFVTCKGQ